MKLISDSFGFWIIRLMPMFKDWVRLHQFVWNDFLANFLQIYLQG